MRKLLAVLIAFAFVFVIPVVPRQQRAEDFLIYVVAQGSAEPVGKALKKKFNSSKPFAVATNDDVSKAVVLISCMDPSLDSHYDRTADQQYPGACTFEPG